MIFFNFASYLWRPVRLSDFATSNYWVRKFENDVRGAFNSWKGKWVTNFGMCCVCPHFGRRQHLKKLHFWKNTYNQNLLTSIFKMGLQLMDCLLEQMREKVLL